MTRAPRSPSAQTNDGVGAISSSPPPRTALITGAARRIGRAIALDMASRGWQIAVHYRKSAEDAEALAGEIRNLGVKAATIKADLSVADDVDALVPACVSALGPPCCLVNNASEFQLDTLQTLTRETWHLHLDTNLKTPVFLAQALAAHLPHGCEGNIINVIDQRVWNLKPDFFSYTISKAGLWTATRMLAQALAPRIRVNAIGPGPVLKSIHQTDADFAAEQASTLMQRGASTAEIAQAVRFILEAPAMTGQMIVLDGGQHLT
ncbi:MAG: SDR family oxidoreductase [Hyphomicrobiaceae bacterium]|nr:SDR family oxidoreductase [Hyphomicrobiaceae bacterium]